MILKLTVPEIVPNQTRLDLFIATHSEISRSQLKTGLKQLLVNAKPAKLSQRVKPLDSIEIEWENQIPHDIEGQNIPLDIIFEDENVTVVNKKQGMVTHPASGNWDKTLVNALLYRWRPKASNSAPILKTDSLKESNIRSGIIHRLDKDTSGVIITARNKKSEEWLQKQFAARRVKKTYAAIVQNRLKSQNGNIKTRIVRDPKNRKRFTTAPLESTVGKFAHTTYRCVAQYKNYSLVLLTLKTGRTHQLRVHMKHIGCPILGDPIYGKKDAAFPQATLMLHARKLSIKLLENTEFSTFIAPFPPHFKKLVRELKNETV